MSAFKAPKHEPKKHPEFKLILVGIMSDAQRADFEERVKSTYTSMSNDLAMYVHCDKATLSITAVEERMETRNGKAVRDVSFSVYHWVNRVTDDYWSLVDRTHLLQKVG